jgi:hypothetical protein
MKTVKSSQPVFGPLNGGLLLRAKRRLRGGLQSAPCRLVLGALGVLMVLLFWEPVLAHCHRSPRTPHLAPWSGAASVHA